MARIALLFSGLPRHWAHCIQSQLQLFQDHAVDVFFHFWDTIDAAEKDEIVAGYRPTAFEFQPRVDFVPLERQIAHLDNINSPSRLMSMYYSWKRVGELFAEHQRTSGVKYDFAVRLRSDLMFFRTLDAFLPKLGGNDLLLSTHNNFDIINDMFALGGVAPILCYHTIYDRLMSYKDNVVFNPELLLSHHLNQNTLGMRFLSTDLVMLVFRPHMVGIPLEECLKEHPGVSKWKDPEIVTSHQQFHGRRAGEQGLLHVENFKNAQLRQLSQGRQGENDIFTNCR